VSFDSSEVTQMGFAVTPDGEGFGDPCGARVRHEESPTAVGRGEKPGLLVARRRLAVELAGVCLGCGEELPGVSTTAHF
jgi:hypothetical protein